MHKVAMNGRKMSVADWIEERGADRGVVLIRLTAGWSLDRALREPLRPPLKHFTNRKKTTPWIGVAYRKDRDSYRVIVHLEHDEPKVRLGDFKCDKEAAALYNVWARNRWGVRARINLT